MRRIMPDINDLKQYLREFKSRRISKPDCCPYCKAPGLWGHGCYYRKPDRETKTLNPIPIARFCCTSCNRTCSLLPECIPPRRWYLWVIQHFGISMVLAGRSIRYVAKQGLVARSTISRWVNSLKNAHAKYAFHLKAYDWALGTHDRIQDFWTNVLTKMKLSRVMLVLNQHGVAVP